MFRPHNVREHAAGRRPILLRPLGSTGRPSLSSRRHIEAKLREEQRWHAVDRLMHHATLRSYTRIGGLFMLLFAQPLPRIVAMRTD